MTKVIVKLDCGNSPKNEFIKQINIAFAKGDADFLMKSVVDSIEWHMHGGKVVRGKEDFQNELNTIKENKVAELILESFFTHGKEGAAKGRLVMQNGKMYCFGDFYRFSSTKSQKLSAITSFINKI